MVAINSSRSASSCWRPDRDHVWDGRLPPRAAPQVEHVVPLELRARGVELSTLHPMLIRTASRPGNSLLRSGPTRSPCQVPHASLLRASIAEGGAQWTSEPCRVSGMDGLAASTGVEAFGMAAPTAGAADAGLCRGV